MTTFGVRRMLAIWARPLALLLPLYLWTSFRYDAVGLLRASGPLRLLGQAGRVLPFLMVAATAMLIFAGREIAGRVNAVHRRYPSPPLLPALAAYALTVPLYLAATQWVFGSGDGSAVTGGMGFTWVASLAALCLAALNVAVPLRGVPALARVLVLPLAVGTAIGAVAWGAAMLSGRLWGSLADATLSFVHGLLRSMGQPVVHEEGTRIIALHNFRVEVAPECSGYEGVGLVAIFLTGHVFRFRHELRFPNALAVPIVGVLSIWVLNIVRIAGLMLIGAYVSRGIAVGGFHAKAGWLLFCATSIGMVAVANHISWLQKDPSRIEAWGDRPAAPFLYPFIAWLSVGLLTGLVTAQFDYAYPLKVLVTGAVLVGVRAIFLPSSFRPAPLALVAGVVVLAVWLAAVPVDARADASFVAGFARMPPWLGGVWTVFRWVGAVLVVPIVEEVAFRGFFMRLLRSRHFEELDYAGTPVWALLLSSLAFGVLHSAWLAATFAGVVYGLVVMRTNRLYDAIVAHALTNLLLSVYVVATGHFGQW